MKAKDGFHSYGMWHFVREWVVQNIWKEDIALVLRDQVVHEDQHVMSQGYVAKSDG